MLNPMEPSSHGKRAPGRLLYSRVGHDGPPEHVRLRTTAPRQNDTRCPP